MRRPGGGRLYGPENNELDDGHVPLASDQALSYCLNSTFRKKEHECPGYARAERATAIAATHVEGADTNSLNGTLRVRQSCHCSSKLPLRSSSTRHLLRSEASRRLPLRSYTRHPHPSEVRSRV